MKKYNSFYDFLKDNIYKYYTHKLEESKPENVYLGNFISIPLDKISPQSADARQVANCNSFIMIYNSVTGLTSCFGHTHRLKKGHLLLNELFEINGIMYKLRFYDLSLNTYSNDLTSSGVTCLEVI